MSLQPTIDMQRVQFVLRDLLKTTRGQAPIVELSRPADSMPLRAVASRSGLLRLGLRLALAALEADPTISIHPDGSVTEQGPPGVVEIVLTEETTLPRRPDESFSPILAGFISVTVVAILGLAFIGFGTLLDWLRWK
jgi:hypothetical protein